MLIKFSVENWRCFKDKATINLTATNERQHKERLPAVGKYRMKLLPISAIYGANASGKTKFVEALAFLKFLLLDGTTNKAQKINIQRFKLDASCLKKPTIFSITTLIDGFIYYYEISLLPEKILSEKLIVENTSMAYDVFTRESGQPIKFDTDYFSKEDIDFMRFVEKATRDNEPFLTNANKLNAAKLSPLYDWFANKLTIIFPQSMFTQRVRYADPGDILSKNAVTLMTELHTGIDHFETVVVPKDNIPLPKEIIDSLIEQWQKTGEPVRWGDCMIRRNQSSDEPVFEQLIPVHKNELGENVQFKLSDESDGTLRLLDLIPALSALKFSSEQVVVVDELDRSLHTNMLEWLIKYYLNSCTPKTTNQLIMTTHDVNILTQNIFRRDELRGIDKHNYGSSSIYSFRDFKDIRSDKDIRKIYLSGLMGAVPYLEEESW